MRPVRLTLKQKQKLYELFVSGVTTLSLAERYGISRSSAQKIIEQAKKAVESRRN